MNRNAIAHATVYCVDLAKNKFQVHGFSASGERLLQATFSRSQCDAFFGGSSTSRKVGKPPVAKLGARVVMEACGGGHYWGRCLQGRGYAPKLVPPQFVAKQRLGNKNDGNDADAIFAVHGDARVRPVPIKTVAQQDLCAQHRVRELLVSQRTQYINQVRGLLAERGWVAVRGQAGFAELLARVAEQAPTAEVTATMAELIDVIAQQIRRVNTEIAALEGRLSQALAESPVAQRIDSIFGVGLVTATAFAGEFGDHVERFADARQFAASIGITPSEHSSGEQRKLGHITKRGNPYLRKLLVQCAQSILRAQARHDDATCVLARRLLEKNKHHNAVVIALANRVARIIYGVIKHKTDYQPHGRVQPA